MSDLLSSIPTPGKTRLCEGGGYPDRIDIYKTVAGRERPALNMNVTYLLVGAPDQQKSQGNAVNLHLLSECASPCCNDLLLTSHFASLAFQCELNIRDSLGVSRHSSWNPKCPGLGSH